jgi:hypothetical protein
MGNKETSDCRSLETLIAEVREHLDCLGYSTEARRHFDIVWRNLAAFAASTGTERMSGDLAEAFLNHRGVGAAGLNSPSASWQRHLQAAVRILQEFQLHGCFQRRRSVSRMKLSEELATILAEYERFCVEELRIRPRTMRGRRRNIFRFLIYLASNGKTDMLLNVNYIHDGEM